MTKFKFTCIPKNIPKVTETAIALYFYRIHLYPEGKHNVHLRYPDDFNTQVEKFLL